MSKRIWIVNYYTGTPQTVSNPRYVQFSSYFMEAGYDVLTFNAVHDGDKTRPQFDFKEYDGHKFIHVRCMSYVGNGIKRMMSIFTFAWKIYRHAKDFDKPDVVLHNIHPPFDYPIVLAAKKLKAKYIAEAWDLWPEAFVQTGFVSEKNIVMKIFHQIEKRFYYNSDQLIFTFLGAFDYLKRRGWTKETGGKIETERLHYINNGVDIAKFEKDKQGHARNDDELNDDETIKVIYLGSINHANNIKLLLDAAALLKEDKRYKFYIYGDGAERDDLQNYSKDNKLSNVSFRDKRIPFEDCAWVVSQATVNVMNYERNFGCHGISSGKMFQYLAAGKPILCNIDIAYDDIITDNNIGIAKEFSNAQEYVNALKQLAEQSDEEYIAMCNRVKETAKKFDYKVLSQKELEVIEKVI